MFWKTLAIVYGGFAALFPRKTIDYLTRIVLACYENPEDLEPAPWFVSLVRLEGILFALAGATSILLSVFFDRRSKADGDEGSLLGRFR